MTNFCSVICSILKVDFALKLSNYASLKRFTVLKWILKKFLHNTTFSVQLPYIASHSLFIKNRLKLRLIYISYTVTLKFNGLKVSFYCTIMQNVYPLVRDISLDTKERWKSLFRPKSSFCIIYNSDRKSREKTSFSSQI